METDTQAQNEAVEQALLRKATGYTYTQEDSYKLKTIDYDDKGKKLREAERVEVIQVEKQVQPEFSAIALWLKNRMPRRWGESAEEFLPVPVQIIDDIPVCSAQCPEHRQSQKAEPALQGDKSAQEGHTGVQAADCYTKKLRSATKKKPAPVQEASQ